MEIFNPALKYSEGLWSIRPLRLPDISILEIERNSGGLCAVLLKWA